jgi:hypothetical protein
VDCECAIDGSVLGEKPIIDHALCSAIALFAWLKHQHNATMELPAVVDQYLCGTKQHGHVRIVTTSVHCSEVGRRELEAG